MLKKIFSLQGLLVALGTLQMLFVLLTAVGVSGEVGNPADHLREIWTFVGLVGVITLFQVIIATWNATEGDGRLFSAAGLALYGLTMSAIAHAIAAPCLGIMPASSALCFIADHRFAIGTVIGLCFIAQACIDYDAFQSVKKLWKLRRT